MVDRIGSGAGSLAQEAFQAALKRYHEASARMQEAAAELTSKESAPAETKLTEGFAEKLHDGLRAVNDDIRSAEKLPEDLIAGRVDAFHEVAAQIKRADLSFKFAMEVRNKLIDAYREVMRMHV